MGLLGRQIVCLSKGLDEVVVSPRRHLDGEFCRQPPEQGAIQWLAGCPKTVGGVHAPEQPKWEVELAIVNFRYAPQGLAPQQQDKRSMVISQRMVEAGFACVLTAQLKGRTVLLICSIHPAATEEEIRYTIQLLDKYAVR